MGSDAANDAKRGELKTAWFHILLALADGAQHGYAIRRSVKERTQGAVKLYPATLYGSIRELSERGLIEALEGEEDPDEDQRRRYYRLTEAGRNALADEVGRLQAILDQARATRALSGA
jgi:DNA-binding PadR family transcriptional regulator